MFHFTNQIVVGTALGYFIASLCAYLCLTDFMKNAINKRKIKESSDDEEVNKIRMR